MTNQVKICKYHGRSCEIPMRCLSDAPRKYVGDGHLETIDPERLTAGCVVRFPYSGGAIPAYNDATITRIYVKSWKDARDDRSYDNLKEAIAARKTDNYVWVKVARPYLYANTIGCVANWLVGVEHYEINGETIAESHKVVVQSTGEYAKYGEAT